MAIKWTWQRLPVDESGKAYDSLEVFQAAMLSKTLANGAVGISAELIVKKKAEVLEILNITMSARPSTRGVAKPRKNKTKAKEPDPAVKAA